MNEEVTLTEGDRDAKVAEAARRKALEDACRASCAHCFDGVPVEWRDEGAWWMHPGRGICAAYRIQSLFRWEGV